MLVALFFLTGFIFIFFFAQSLEMLLVAEILCGVPWGSRCFRPFYMFDLYSDISSIPNVDHVLCFGSRSCRSSRLPHHLGKCIDHTTLQVLID